MAKALPRPLLAAALALLPVLVLAHGISEADRQRMLDGGYLQYVWLGATHMLTGYDHLLFLFGVVFFLTTFKDIAKFVTAFTVGHCITLILATFYQITWNYYLIDALIAVSVIYKGFDNNGGFQKYFDVRSPNLLWVVFGFGLLHGFGLSTDSTVAARRRPHEPAAAHTELQSGRGAGADRGADGDGGRARGVAPTSVVQTFRHHFECCSDVCRSPAAAHAIAQLSPRCCA